MIVFFTSVGVSFMSIPVAIMGKGGDRWGKAMTRTIAISILAILCLLAYFTIYVPGYETIL